MWCIVPETTEWFVTKYLDEACYDSDGYDVIYLPRPQGREFPYSVALDRFVVEEAVNRIRFPGRITVVIRADLEYRALNAPYEWKNLSEEDFDEGALPDMDMYLRKAMALHKDAAPLQDILAMFEGQGGGEIRREYCRSFYHSLQQVPDSELCKQYPRK